jgi:hypothetical protein
LELELVRGHAAELQETVAEQKREMSEQRQAMGEQLQQLRFLLEQQAVAPASVQPEAAPQVPAPTPPARESKQEAADPVVSSVMAQFAKLQQDVAQRRKARK